MTTVLDSSIILAGLLAFARSDPEEARAWLTPEQLREFERRVAETRVGD